MRRRPLRNLWLVYMVPKGGVTAGAWFMHSNHDTLKGAKRCVAALIGGSYGYKIVRYKSEGLA